jgi:hypothetical protein
MVSTPPLLRAALVVRVHDIPQDMTDTVDQADVSTDCDVAMVRRRTRQLA